MPFIATIPTDQAQGPLADIYKQLRASFGIVPKIFESLSLRPDLLEPLVLYIHRLMIEDHELTRSDKELIAAHVSRLNACAY